ncbi:hypothetical protein PASE110613_02080 [Paenibacillus sediminis]|uniref:Ferric iron reductase protein FhuF n=1 Tax=Paenibacillus sediminis TaxID=664909 RepID=A0ABS4GZD6_9BACL|nr:hypothetical protein [Paenibacillus sediminis]MBP1935625.1 ferric iron reductase protein FhuF [Paenibacillus sediminis]
MRLSTQLIEYVADHFRLYIEEPNRYIAYENSYTIRTSDLLDHHHFVDALTFYASTYHTEQAARNSFKSIVASTLVKHIARSVCGILYLWSIEKVPLVIQKDRLHLEITDAGNLSLHYEYDEEDSNDDFQLDNVASAMFKHFLSPLFLQIHQISHLKIEILWESTLLYVRHEYGEFYSRASTNQEKRSIQTDFNHLLAHSSASWFGTASNPLLHSVPGGVIPDITDKALVRQHCCLRHNLPNKTYCKVCPIAHK